MLKTCLQCGKQFELKVYNKKFCSPLCKYNYAYKKFKDKKLKNRRTEQKKIKTKKMKSKTCFSCVVNLFNRLLEVKNFVQMSAA